MWAARPFCDQVTEDPDFRLARRLSPLAFRLAHKLPYPGAHVAGTEGGLWPRTSQDPNPENSRVHELRAQSPGTVAAQPPPGQQSP